MVRINWRCGVPAVMVYPKFGGGGGGYCYSSDGDDCGGGWTRVCRYSH